MGRYNFFKSALYGYFSVIRNAFVMLFPIYIISSFIILFATIMDLLGHKEQFSYLKELHGAINILLPAILTLCIGYFYSMKYNLPKLTVAISITILFEVISLFFKDYGFMFIYLIASVLPFFFVPIINYLYSKRWSKIANSNHLNESLTQSFNILIPIMLLTSILYIMALIYNATLAHYEFVYKFDFSYLTLESGAYLFAFLNSTLWWFGIHGGQFLIGFSGVVSSNAEVTELYVNNVLNAFVFLGGSGATISLILAILLVCKIRNYRLVALSALPFGLINVNEILVFGLPILFNPLLLIPFILAPMVNIFVFSIASDLHFISISTNEVGFSTFMFFNAWLATNEGINGIMVQLISIAIGTLIYIPFVARLNTAQKSIEFTSFNSQFSNQTDEVVFALDDSVRQNAQNEFKNKEIIRNLERVSKYKYLLYYQPQICPHTNKIVGCESLIRAINSDGKLVLPYDFLPWFDSANMNKTIDMWVLQEAYKQTLIFKEQDIDIPISVNVSGNMLQDEDFIDMATKILEKSNKMINIELTEKLLANDDNIKNILTQFQLAGAKNYIDDFGTEYSSLSYLYKLPIDAIKIDRSFVLALDEQKGRDIMEGILLLAKKMEYKVVVEGVETEDQLDFVKKCNSLSIQGWYYSKALSSDDFISYCNSFSSKNN